MLARELAAIANPVIRKRDKIEARFREIQKREDAREWKKLLVEAGEFFRKHEAELEDLAREGERETELNLWTESTMLAKAVCQVFKKHGFRATSKCIYSPGWGAFTGGGSSSYAITLAW